MMKRILKNTFFCFFPKRHADLYKTMRSEITGGPSIILMRVAIASKTKIRSNEINDPETIR